MSKLKTPIQRIVAAIEAVDTRGSKLAERVAQLESELRILRDQLDLAARVARLEEAQRD